MRAFQFAQPRSRNGFDIGAVTHANGSRVVDQVIAQALSIAVAVLIEGVRACGKTATGLQHSRSAVLLDTDADARELAALSPALVLEGERPRLLDEWQLEPRLWNHVRRTVDERRRPGQFILTGSATPTDDVTRHSGSGRILRVRMRPMSLLESGHSTGSVSLARLLDGEPVAGAKANLDLHGIVERIRIGGWPGLQHLGVEGAQTLLRSYLDDVARADIQAADDTATRRDPTESAASWQRTPATSPPRQRCRRSLRTRPRTRTGP